MTQHYIDPIKVKEEQKRLEDLHYLISRGSEAADALLWFHEYARSEAERVLTATAKLTASSTPKADMAQRYVTAAAKRFTQQILDAAIQDARNDFDRAEVRRKAKPEQ